MARDPHVSTAVTCDPCSLPHFSFVTLTVFKSKIGSKIVCNYKCCFLLSPCMMGQLPQPGACGVGAGGHGELRGGERDHSPGSDPAPLSPPVPVGSSALGDSGPLPHLTEGKAFPGVP